MGTLIRPLFQLLFGRTLLAFWVLGFFSLFPPSSTFAQNSRGVGTALKPIENEGTQTFDKLRGQYTKALQKAHAPIEENYLKALNRLLDEYAASGDLEASLAVKVRIEAYEKSRIENKTESVAKGGGSMATTSASGERNSSGVEIARVESSKPSGKEIEVADTKWTWTVPTASIVFSKDGTAKTSHPKRVIDESRSTYSWERVSDDTFSLLSKDGINKAEIRVSEDQNTATFTSFSPREFTLVLERLKLDK